MSDVVSATAAVHLVALGLATVLLAIASLNDIAARTIPDLAPLGVAVIGLVVRLIDGNAATALAASAMVFVLAVLCWRFGWLGGGDAKLLAACAWLVSPGLVPQLVLLTAFAGGFLACLYLILNRVSRSLRPPAQAARPRSLVFRVARAEWWRIRRRATLPYGCAIAVGTLLTLFGG